MKISRPVVIASMLVFALAGTSEVFAAPGKSSPAGATSSSSSSSSSGGSSGSRSFILTVPLVSMTRDAVFRGELNTVSASFSVESAFMGAAEEYPEEKLLLTGDSMITSGRQASILVSRYSNQSNMSGWFWTLGAGARQMDGIWKTSPSTLALMTGINLVQDSAGKVLHNYKATGTTGHARVGYRWVSRSIPLAIGGHIGIRHFEGKFEDAAPLDPDYTPLAVDEKASLRRRYMTRLEPAVEFGLAF